MVPDHWSNDAMVSMDRCGLCPGAQKIAWSKYAGDKLSWVQPGSHLSQLILITKIKKKSSPGSSAGDSQAFWDFVPILSWM